MLLATKERDREAPDEIIDGEFSVMLQLHELLSPLTIAVIASSFLLFFLCRLVLSHLVNREVAFVIALSASLIPAALYLTGGNWKYALIAAGSTLIAGLILATLARQLSPPSPTVIPSADSPIDERWGPLQLESWFAANQLGPYAARFGLTVPGFPPPPTSTRPFTGAEMLQVTEHDLLRQPLYVSDGRARTAIASAIAEGLLLHERRFRSGAPFSAALAVALPSVQKRMQMNG